MPPASADLPACYAVPRKPLTGTGHGGLRAGVPSVFSAGSARAQQASQMIAADPGAAAINRLAGRSQ